MRLGNPVGISTSEMNRPFRPLAFADMTEGELVATHNIAPIKKFSEGTAVAEGEAQQNGCYVVINGSLRLVSSAKRGG